MKIILEIEGDAEKGFHGKVLSLEGVGPAEESACRQVVTAIERLLSDQNADIGATE